MNEQAHCMCQQSKDEAGRLSRIVIFLGTQAELIKMIPILKLLDEHAVPYSFLHTGQHTGSSREIIRQFGLKEPDLYLAPQERNLDCIPGVLVWMWRCARSAMRQKVIRSTDLVLVHGDTESTLLGVLLARWSGARVGHVEAGLRSGRLFKPFPEEMTRRLADRCSTYLYAHGRLAADNLKRSKVRGHIVDTKVNINKETLSCALKMCDPDPDSEPKPPYVLLMVHRKETIFVRRKLRNLVAVIAQLTEHFPVLFVMADKTRHRLKRTGYLKKLRQMQGLKILPFQPYPKFLQLVQRSEFVATDGGSLQEETFYLNKPCLILREVTEREEGIGETACLAGLDPKKINRFLNTYSSFRRRIPDENEDGRPAGIIVDHMLSVTGN